MFDSLDLMLTLVGSIKRFANKARQIAIKAQVKVELNNWLVNSAVVVSQLGCIKSTKPLPSIFWHQKSNYGVDLTLRYLSSI